MKRTSLPRQLLVPGLALALSATACGNRVIGQQAAARPALAAGGTPGEPGPATGGSASTTPDPSLTTAVANGPATASPAGVASPHGAVGSSPATGASRLQAPTPVTAAAGSAGSAPAKAAGAPRAAPAAGATPPPAPGPGSPPPAAGGNEPLVIASVGQLSGVVGQAISAGSKAVAAWAGAVNQAGGVSGHPVQYLVADDGADPGRHQALVREMVEQRHVIAFVYQLAPFSGSSSVKYLEQKRVPVIGSEAASGWFDTSPVFFEQSTQGALAAVPMLGPAAALNPGKTKVGVIVCAEGVAICEDAKRLMPQWAPKFGLKVVQMLSASLAQPDYTAECLSLRNAGAELVAFIGDANSLLRTAHSCANAGFRPSYFFAQQQAQNQFLNEPLLEGAAGDALTAPWFLSSSRPVAEFQAALKRYAPGTPPDGQTSFGWASAKLFERAVTSVSGPITSEALLKALWSLRGETLGGFTMPLAYATEQPSPQKVCFSTVKIEKGQFTSTDGGAFHCVE